MKFIEELNDEEQKEFTRLVDKNEDLFRENMKIKNDFSSLKNELEETKKKSSENEKKAHDLLHEKEKTQKIAEDLKNKKKSMKIILQKLEFPILLITFIEFTIDLKKEKCFQES